MKNLFLSFALVASFNAFAGNTAGVTYNDIDSIDGPGLTLSGVSGSFVYDVDLMRLEASNGASDTFHQVQALYAFGDASEGSWYIGVHRLGADSDDITDATVGYVKRGSNGVDWKFGYVGGDFDALNLEVKIPVGSGNLELNMLNGEGDPLNTIGYTWNF